MAKCFHRIPHHVYVKKDCVRSLALVQGRLALSCGTWKDMTQS